MTDEQTLAILRVLERVADGLEGITAYLSYIDEDLKGKNLKKPETQNEV